MAKKVTRRSFMKTSTFAALGLAAGHLMSVRSARGAEPVKILIGTTFSGAYAETGLYTRRANTIALDLFGGEVLGRPIELIERDVPNPAEGVRKAQEAVENLGAKFLIISPSSSTVLAVMEYADKKGAFMIGSGGSDKITGEACNKYTFRWPVATWSASREVVPRIIDEYKADSFYTITPKYVFGEDLLKNCVDVMKSKGKKHLGNAYHPLGESDFSSHLTNAMSAKPDCVLFLNFGGDTVSSLKQATNFGLPKVSKIACAWGSGITQMKALGAETMRGIIWGLNYFYKIDAPGNKKFVAAFHKAYNEVPPYVAASAYIHLKLVLEGIDRAGSDDPLKVAKALEGYEYEGLTGTETIRACDHQVIKPYYTIKCKGPTAMKTPEDFGDIIGQSTNVLPCEETGCKMA